MFRFWKSMAIHKLFSSAATGHPSALVCAWQEPLWALFGCLFNISGLFTALQVSMVMTNYRLVWFFFFFQF